MTDKEQAARLDHLREQLAALESYGNGDDPRADAVRAEIEQLSPRPKRGK